MKIKYIDTLCTNGTHLVFNASLLAMLSRLYSEIDVYGEKNNVKDQLNLLVKEKEDISRIKSHYIWLPIVRSRISYFLLYCFSVVYNLFFIIFSQSKDILVYNYSNMLSLRLMNMLNKIFKRKIIIFCHGEMEYLHSSVDFFGPFNRFIFKTGRNFFLNKNIKIEKSIKFVVLGDSILKNVIDLLPDNFSDSFFSVDHPYIFSEKTENTQITNRLNIGTVGLFNKAKGADDFCKLCSLIHRNDIQFSITGKILYDINILKRLGINLPSNEGKDVLPRKELEERIRKLDVILYLYNKESYKFIASGAIFDAINMNKPIVAIKNNYFSYIFEKFGTFGYLEDSVEQIAELLNNFEKHQISFDFYEIQQKLSVNAISLDLKDKLEKLQLL